MITIFQCVCEATVSISPWPENKIKSQVFLECWKSMEETGKKKKT